MNSQRLAPPVSGVDHLQEDSLAASQRPKARRSGLRAATAVAGSLVMMTGLVGALHFPFAAPVLRMIFPGSICPVMRGTPAQIDRAHDIGAAAIRREASTPAPVRLALGFELDHTRKSDLDAWAVRNGVSCGAIAGNANLQRCINVPPAAIGEAAELGTLEEVTFEFRSTGELTNVQTLRRHLSAAGAAQVAARIETGVATAIGAPSTVGGEPTVAHLSRGVLASYVAVHAFSDYRATVSATNLAPTGMMVREEYLSAR